MAKQSVETPLMSQYNAIKTKHPDAVLLFRVGDFYETFGEDAVECSRILGIVLTKRGAGAPSETPLAGFPYHAIDTYLPKLVLAGKRVAICDQLEDPKLTKKIVKRGVTELVTPGVAMNDQVLSSGKNNFLAAVHFGQRNVGLAFLDVSTGEFLVSEGPQGQAAKFLETFAPSEVLHERRMKMRFREMFGEGYRTYMLDDWAFSENFGRETLQKHFKTASLKGFGIDRMSEGIAAAGAVMEYLRQTEHTKVDHISRISRIQSDTYVWLDRFTARNLEILSSPNDNASTLLDVLDRTLSPMGARMLKRWLMLPLKDLEEIHGRQGAVKYFLSEEEKADELRRYISSVSDMERLAAKVATGRINPKELSALCASLEVAGPVKNILSQASGNALLARLARSVDGCGDLCTRIRQTLAPDAPSLLSKGWVIAEGVDGELDELRMMLHSNKTILNGIIEHEAERTGISSLKIAFNNVFGYYIEVRNAHKDKVPPEWIRKQTTVSAERYITPELKEFEAKILGAEDRIAQIESRLYGELVEECGRYIMAIQENSRALAETDCLLSFARVAQDNGYCCPEVDESTDIEIIEGRHPVIEQRLPPEQPYIPNSVTLNRETQQIIMITGPNMSGKSALLRQTALICLMAQTGGYVPARSARIGVVDRIFTRVGASDNLSSGESTFMVEMNETASILNNISERSLIILDEIGRGTSTYDGISIAWAISEYLHDSAQRPKTLFATHYHELNEMAETFSRIKNFNVTVRELDGDVIFTRKLEQGGSNHSFGIHVAQMAGMPHKVLLRASEILREMEKTQPAGLAGGHDTLVEGAGKGKFRKKKVQADAEDNIQLSIFQLDDPTLVNIKEQLKGIDINGLTPVEALVKLSEIKKSIGLKD